MENALTVGTLLEVIKLRLDAVGIENAGNDAELILMEELNLSRGQLAADNDKIISDEKAELLERIVERRLKHEPLQYIFGKAYFMNMWFHVAPGVLIPRPETELLVEKVCREAPQGAEICDLGVGCGTIALAVACERRDLHVIGVDVSRPALKIAEANRREWKLENVQLLRSDLFSALSGRRFDYITANLPYISPAEYQLLVAEVKDYEPELALQAEDDGLAVIRRAVISAPDFMKPDAGIIFEIGVTQGGAVKEFMSATGRYADISIIQDYNRHDRFVAGKLASAHS
ncbi:MAG: peptide chain release factor N(5)-glutamine methyltransferase [Victivallaceae bacterium]